MKTEIGPLDGTPEKRLFWSIISDYGLKVALTELVDNAIDVWTESGKTNILNVDIELDADRQIIRLMDNAGGVAAKDLRLLITPGGSNNSPDAQTIGIFGVGSKRAVIAIAEQVTIKTRHTVGKSFQIDIGAEWLESEDWSLPYYEISEIELGTTQIELTKLRQKITEDDVLDLLAYFGDVYSNFVHATNCNIRINGKLAIGRKFDVWAFPPSHEPHDVTFETWPDGTGKLEVRVTAGLIRDRHPSAENYGVYFYCNDRLIVKELRSREVGYYVSGEAGVPHFDASLCRAIVQIKGPAKLMPWNSNKTSINFEHPAFRHLRPTLIQLVSHFSSLSRRLSDSWPEKVFQYNTGVTKVVPPQVAVKQQKLVLPALPKVRKSQTESLKSKNSGTIASQPWTLGLIEAIAAVEIVARQKLQTKNRISLILLDSNFEIALKEFIVHREDLFPPKVYTDTKIKEIFAKRHLVLDEIHQKHPLSSGLVVKAKHYYNARNKLIHERATIDLPPADIENYQGVIEQVLWELFGLQF